MPNKVSIPDAAPEYQPGDIFVCHHTGEFYLQTFMLIEWCDNFSTVSLNTGKIFNSHCKTTKQAANNLVYVGSNMKINITHQ